MTDPLSVTASIAGVVSLGLTLSSGLLKFVQAVKGAPKDLTVICNDIWALCGILEQIKEITATEQVKLNSNAIEHALKNCKHMFARIKEELEKASKQVNVRGFASLIHGEKISLSFGERGGYFFRQNELNQLKNEILQSKTTLILAVSIVEIRKLDILQQSTSQSQLKKEHSRERDQLLNMVASLNSQLAELQAQQDASQRPDNAPPPAGGHETRFPFTPPESSVISSSSASGPGTDKAPPDFGTFALVPGDSGNDVDDDGEDATTAAAAAFSGSSSSRRRRIRAWTTSAEPRSHAPPFGIACAIEPVHLQEAELLQLVNLQEKHIMQHQHQRHQQNQQNKSNDDDGRAKSLSQQLGALNGHTRAMILKHTAELQRQGKRRRDGSGGGMTTTLIAVERAWQVLGRTQTVFGDVDLEAPLWVTVHDGDDGGEEEHDWQEQHPWEEARLLPSSSMLRPAGREVGRQAFNDDEERVRRQIMEEEVMRKEERVERQRMEEEMRRKVEVREPAVSKGRREGLFQLEAELRKLEEELAACKHELNKQATELMQAEEKLAGLRAKLAQLDAVGRPQWTPDQRASAEDIRHGAIPDMEARVRAMEEGLLAQAGKVKEVETRLEERRRRVKLGDAEVEEEVVVETVTEEVDVATTPRASERGTRQQADVRPEVQITAPRADEAEEPHPSAYWGDDEKTLDRDVAEALTRDLIAKWIQG